jgi:beta-lactamase regulating signal transducer with metallopeptidase domain
MSTLNLLLGLAEAAAASIVLPGFAALLARAFPRSATRRRMVWTTLFLILLALPVAGWLAPTLTVITLPAPPATIAVAAAPAPAPEAAEPQIDAITGAFLIGLFAWALGGAWVLARGLVGLVWLERLRFGSSAPSDAPPVELPRRCSLRLSPDCPGPMTWGAVRPVILMPDDAPEWPRERLEAALRHELAHVSAKDSLIQAFALVACALYWPNPIVWRSARALRREAEAAADDAVIAAGVKPSDYASLLLDLAKDWRSPRRPIAEMAMAAPPVLSERVQSILSPDALRNGATVMDTFKLTLLGGSALAALALARPSVAEVSAPAAPAQQLELSGVAPAAPSQAQHIELSGGAPLPSAKAGAVHDQFAQNTQAPPKPIPLAPGQAATVPYNPKTDDPASPGYIAPGQPGAQHPVPAEVAQLLNARKDPGAPWTMAWMQSPNAPSDAPAIPAPPAVSVQPLPAPAAPAPAPAARPASPFPPAAAGGPAANPTWEMGWIPNRNGARASAPPAAGLPPLPPGPPGVVTFRGRLMTPEQQADLDRKLADIGPTINKAIADAHIDETVQKALKDQDPKTREMVAKQLADLGPRIQRIIANAHIQELVAQRMAEIQPQIDAAQAQRAQERAARGEELAKRAQERAATQAKRAEERAKARAQRQKDDEAPAQPPKN